MNKVVSVILRTCERYKVLQRAIDDILSQSYDKWEIILVNDGGDINKINNIIENKKNEIDSRIKIINLEKNKGLNIAINIGAKNVSGEYVVIHDDDDTWHKDFLKECVTYLENNKCMGVVTLTNGVYEYMDKNGEMKIKKIKPYNPRLKGVIAINELIQQNQFPPISFMYRSNVYKEIGYYNEEMAVLEDWEFYLRFILKYDIFVINKYLANYHIRLNETDPVLGNTITNRREEHEKYGEILRNNFIRKYINNGERLGLLMGIYKGQQFNGVKYIAEKIHRILCKF